MRLEVMCVEEPAGFGYVLPLAAPGSVDTSSTRDCPNAGRFRSGARSSAAGDHSEYVTASASQGARIACPRTPQTPRGARPRSRNTRRQVIGSTCASGIVTTLITALGCDDLFVAASLVGLPACQLGTQKNQHGVLMTRAAAATWQRRSFGAHRRVSD